MRSRPIAPKKIPRKENGVAKKVPIVKWPKGRVPKLLSDEIDFDISENDFYAEKTATRAFPGGEVVEVYELPNLKAALEDCLKLPVTVSEPQTVSKEPPSEEKVVDLSTSEDAAKNPISVRAISPPTISIHEPHAPAKKRQTWKAKVDKIAESLLASQKLTAPRPPHSLPTSGHTLLPPLNLHISGWTFPEDFRKQVKFKGGSLLHFWLATQEQTGRYKDIGCQVGHTLKEIVDDLLGIIFRRKFYSASNPEIIVFDYSLRIVFNDTPAVYIPEILHIIVPHVYCTGQSEKVFKCAISNFYRHYNTEHSLPNLGIQVPFIRWDAGTIGSQGPVIDSLVAVPFPLTRLLRFAHPNYPQDFGCMKKSTLSEFVLQYLLAPCRRHLSDGNNKIFFVGPDPISKILKVDVLHVSQVPKILEVICPPRIYNQYS